MMLYKKYYLLEKIFLSKLYFNIFKNNTKTDL